MRVQICSKCKQPRKGHICPYGDPNVKVDAKVEDDSQSDSSTRQASSQPETYPSQPAINFNALQGPPLSNEIISQPSPGISTTTPPHTVQVPQPMQQVHTYRNNGEGPPNSKIPLSNGFSATGNDTTSQNLEFVPNPTLGNYPALDSQRRASDISALSEELVQKATRLHQETDALVILYVTGSKNERGQSNIHRFISAPLTEHTGMFEDVDRNCVELLDSCKNTQNASRDELVSILTERTHELYQSRRQLESLKRKLGYM
ncbi:hypothetical protein K7432_010036 [Basidiobolus ranarum]|uniref:Uncharacterized protein n=1 Tax=Basidiobolus ranarum TaxID=34480 RepID=A0ABR2VWJ6_9FUNG